MALSFNPRTWEVEAGGSLFIYIVPEKPEPHSKTLCFTPPPQKSPTNKQKNPLIEFMFFLLISHLFWRMRSHHVSPFVINFIFLYDQIWASSPNNKSDPVKEENLPKCSLSLGPNEVSLWDHGPWPDVILKLAFQDLFCSAGSVPVHAGWQRYFSQRTELCLVCHCWPLWRKKIVIFIHNVSPPSV